MKTKNEVGQEYNLNSNGRVISPGKFENEMWYAVSLWDICLEGFSDDDLGDGYGVVLTDDDKTSMGVNAYGIILIEDDNGFVYANECNEEEYERWLDHES